MDLRDRVLHRTGDTPAWVMALYLCEVRIIANMVTAPILLEILIHHGTSRDVFRDCERLEDRNGIRLAAADIVNFGDARRRDESCNKRRDIGAMDVVAY